MNELEIVPFQFNGSQVRTIEKDGEIYFVAKDITDILGYTNGRDAISKHCKAANSVAIRDGIGNPNVAIIPERDLYRLIIKSKLPAAERFEEWVVGEVLPSIRQTGHYAMERMTDLELHRKMVQVLEREEATRIEKELLQEKINSNVLFPKIEPQDNGAEHMALTKIKAEIAPYLSIEKIKDILRYYGHAKTIVTLDSGMKFSSFQREELEAVFHQFGTDANGEVSSSGKTLKVTHECFGNDEYAVISRAQAIQYLGYAVDDF